MEDKNVPAVEETEDSVQEQTNEEQSSEAVEPQEETQEPTEQVEEQEPEAEPVEEPADEEPEPKPSRRESLRIQQLLEKMKQVPQPVQQPVQPNRLDYNEALDADPATIQQFEQDRRAVEQASYQQGLEQAKSIQFHTRLDIDGPRVEQKYPILNQESPEFNPAVADAVNSWFLQMAGYDPATDTVANPNVRYSDFVDSYMELVEKTAGQKVTQSSKQIAKQAAQTGIRPDGSAAKKLDLNKAPEDMTDEELQARINKDLGIK